MDIYVGIDPGQVNMALLAYAPETQEIVSKHKPKFDAALIGVQRLSFLMHDIKYWLGQVETRGTIKQICIEGYSHAERFGAHQSGEVGSVIRLALVGYYGLNNKLGYPAIVTPNTLKLFITGKGNANKTEMIMAIFKRWHEEFKDHNEADAYSLAQLAYALESSPETLLAFQRRALDKVQKHTDWSVITPWLQQSSQPATRSRRTNPTTSSSSKSKQVATPTPTQESSPTRSTKAKRSQSGRSGHPRLIRRSARRS